MRLAVLTLLALGCAISRSSAQPQHVAPTPPKSPAEERATFRLPPGFEAQLVAAEPQVQKPINMAFDARGRLWVTDTIEYPFPAAEGQGRDTVKILEDFGPDGRARKVTTFADKLNIPIGVLPYEDGAIVYSIPNLWRLRDTDGDGTCDRREVLYSGFGHKDTHGMINGLVMGFDGWVYCCHGYANDSVVKGKDGSEVRMNSGNVFRVKADGSRVEMVSRGQVNPFGQCIDPLGNHYTACCHSKPITQLLRGAIYSSFAKPHDGLGFGPDMVHRYRGSTALCGLAWYEADHYPADYRGRLFLGDVINNCINIFDVERKGGTYTAHQQRGDFLTSSDPWFRPVDIKLGPDGALYVADFYNRIIGHYEVPLNHPGRDRTSGRIWRIVYTGADGKAAPTKAPRADWTKASFDELIQDLGHANLVVRLTAMQQLVERGKAEGQTGDARSLVSALKQITSVPAHVHALWVLERIYELSDDELRTALRHEDVAVRVQALRILAERPALPNEHRIVVHALANGGDGFVRRVATDVLARHPQRPSEARSQVRTTLDQLLQVRRELETTADPFLLHAVRMALREQVRDISPWNVPREHAHLLADIAPGLPTLGAGNFLVDYADLLQERQPKRMAEYIRHAARYADFNHLDALYKNFFLKHAEAEESIGIALAQAVLRGFQERGSDTDERFGEWARSRCVRLLAADKTEENRRGIELALLLKHGGLTGNVAALAVNRGRPDDTRAAACAALATLAPKTHLNTLALRLADASESPVLREKIAQALAGVNAAEARSELLKALPTAPARVASAIAAGLAGTPEGAERLLEAVHAGQASPRLLTEPAVSLRLLATKLPNMQARIESLTAGLPPADANLARLLRQRHNGFVRAKPDVAAGAKLYAQHCGNCHQIGGVGAKIGPQLDGIGARGLDRLLEDVLDPNRNIDHTFRATSIVLKSGQSLSGLVLREEGQVIVLSDAQGKEVRVEKTNVESRDQVPLSPMPANWAEQIAEKDFYDLMGYLLNQRTGK